MRPLQKYNQYIGDAELEAKKLRFLNLMGDVLSSMNGGAAPAVQKKSGEFVPATGPPSVLSAFSGFMAELAARRKSVDGAHRAGTNAVPGEGQPNEDVELLGALAPSLSLADRQFLVDFCYAPADLALAARHAHHHRVVRLHEHFAFDFPNGANSTVGSRTPSPGSKAYHALVLLRRHNKQLCPSPDFFM